MQSAVRLSGYALHAGIATSVTLTRCDGALTLQQGSARVPLADARVERTDAGVKLAHPAGLDVDLVEHLLAALGGLGLTRGVLIGVEGPELPLLDGGARCYAEALLELFGAPKAPAPQLTITRRETLRHQTSTYEFVPRREATMEVQIAFDHPAIGEQHARWDGAAASFIRDIAPARTFGFRKDAHALWERGRARLGSRPEQWAALQRSVLVYGDPAARDETPAAEPNEVARHKLLDLIGDFTVYGGPPAGAVTALRPGHTATHDVVVRALASGLLLRT